MAKSKQNICCQQVLLHPDCELAAVLEYVGGEANKVCNCAVYYARQVWFKEKRFVKQSELCRQMKWNPHFTAMYVSSAQQVWNGVVVAFRGFRELLKLFWAGQLEVKPKPPNYGNAGLFTASYPKRWLKLTELGVRVPLGGKVKAWFGLEDFYLPMPSNLDWQAIKEVGTLPRNGCFYAEFVCGVESEKPVPDPSKALGIDHGLGNRLTCVDTRGSSFIVDGRQLKSVNQWYNKRVATLKEGQSQSFWSKRLASLTERRNRQMRDAVNKAARLVVNRCLKHGIGTIVFGWNLRQKDGANMGRFSNQSFVQIPTARLKERIKQLWELYGLQCVEHEEACTSKACYLDGDTVPAYSEKPDSWEPSGKRVKRGLYLTALNWYVSADANGAANLLAKVARTLGLDLRGLGRGALTTPVRVRFWTTPESPSRDSRGESIIPQHGIIL
jgi:putative transposase